VKRTLFAYGVAGLVAIAGAAALAQSSAPPLRVVPMGETERPAPKTPSSKSSATKAPATKASTTKAPVAKASVAKAPLAKAAATKAPTTVATPTRPASRPVTSAQNATTRAPTSATTTRSSTTVARAAAATPVRSPAPTSAPKAAPARAAAAQAAPRPAVAATPRPATPVAATTIGPQSAADWRPLDPENAIVYDTTKGRIIVELAPELAPGHVARIKELARAKFYDGLAFHRVINDFMAQGGDPKGDGTGGSDRPNLRGEFNFRRGADTSFVRAIDRGGAVLGWVRTVPVSTQPDILMERTADKRVAAWANHCPGVTSMARAEDENSANSQFFLMRNSYPTLDRRYTVWGRAVIGVDVIRALKVGEPVVDPDRMTSVRVLADIAEEERPKVMIQRTDGPAFKARLATALDERGAQFSNCDLVPDSKIVP
jgi:peptidylprolyl isomerase